MLRVLVVDDNHDVADSMAMMLEILGFDARCVYNGVDALAAIHGYRPHVVMLDIEMPRMDGWEVARRIRTMQEAKELTLMAVTGLGQQKDIAKSEVEGFDHHLVKPVDMDTVASLLWSIRKARKC